MFSQRTIDFLAENRIMDSREWFSEHKPEYTEHIIKPFEELVQKLAPTLLSIDERIICDPKKCISRIHRDTRFSKDKTRYRDMMWCAFSRDKKLYKGYPGFFLEISPLGFRYGCGYCLAETSSMESVRTLILKNDQGFVDALASYEKQDIFTIEGEMYKRSKCPEQSEELRQWLDRKNINFTYRSADLEETFSSGFSSVLTDGFNTLAPMYNFLVRAEEVRIK